MTEKYTLRSYTTQIHILSATLHYLDAPGKWCKGAPAKDHRGRSVSPTVAHVRRCSLRGAIQRIIHVRKWDPVVCIYFFAIPTDILGTYQACEDQTGKFADGVKQSLDLFNDSPATEYEHVLDVLKSAIEDLQKKQQALKDIT